MSGSQAFAKRFMRVTRVEQTGNEIVAELRPDTGHPANRPVDAGVVVYKVELICRGGVGAPLLGDPFEVQLHVP